MRLASSWQCQDEQHPQCAGCGCPCHDGPMTVQQAQELHEQRQAADPGHDRVSCWCCCLDCDFDPARVTCDFAALPEEEP